MKKERLISLLATASVLFFGLNGMGQASGPYTFTTAGASGSVGPIPPDITNEYIGTSLDGQVTGWGPGIQEWIIPKSGYYSIEASGAQGGGSATRPGGLGATVKGDFVLQQGDTLRILVGQTGFIGPSSTQSGNRGGGGGSFVWYPNDTTEPLVAAGGGGGSNVSTSDPLGADGVVSTSGTLKADGNGNPGSNGNGASPGGAGFKSVSTNEDHGSAPVAPIYSGIGGSGYTSSNHHYGGFGGGGGGGGSPSTTFASGGGGGYSGGAGQGTPASVGGGGGGSYNAGLNQVNTPGNNSGDGVVIFTELEMPGNDAGVVSIDSPDVFCPGTHDVVVTIQNFGSTQIDSVDIEWEINGTPQPTVSYSNLLDTVGGTGNYTAQVNLGSYTFTGASYNIEAWTSVPNGITDTTNANDTAFTAVQAGAEAPVNLSTSNVTATSIDLDWDEVGASTEWVIEYGVSGFSTGNGDTVVTTAKPLTLSNLYPNTGYDFYLRSICSGGDTSSYSSILTDTTDSASTDAGVIGLLEPESFCGDSNTLLAVIIQNFGTDTISGFDVTIDWTGTASGSATGTYTGSLVHGEIDTIVLDTVNTFPGGTFNLTAYTQLTGDLDSRNDTLVINNVVFMPGMNKPVITSNTDTTVCEGESALFTASAASDTIIWRDNSGELLTKGDSLLIPSVMQADTFWAYHGSSMSEAVGLNTNSGVGMYIDQTLGRGLGFTTHDDVTIDSVTVYPEGTGTVEIVILDQTTNNVLYTGPVTNVSGPATMGTGSEVANVVPVHATLPPGDYKIGMNYTGITDMIRDVTHPGFPYASPSGSIEITGGSTGSGSPTSNTYYWFYNWQVSVIACESDPVMVTVGVDSLPNVDLGNDTAYCEGDVPNFTFDAGTGASYLWSDASANQTFTADTAGTYWVEVTNANGCIGTDTVEVTENNVPTVNLGSDTSYCEGDVPNFTFDAGTGASYLWSDSSTNSTLTADTAGIYRVEVTTAMGCVGSDTIEVTENQLPVVALGSDIEYCENEAFTTNLDAGAHTDGLFNWNTGDVGQTLMIDSAGVYWVVVHDTVTGCENTDTVTVIENTAPTVTVNDEEVCEGETATLDAGTGHASYSWSTQETSQSIDVTTDGQYTVTVTNNDGCEDEATATVTVHPLPNVDLGSDTALAANQSITLHAPTGMASYDWSTGETSQTIEVEFDDTPGDFWVEVVSNEGCSGSDTIVIDRTTSAAGAQLLNGDIKLFPNPVQNEANLEVNLVKTGTIEIEVFSVSGQILTTKRVGANTGTNMIPVEMSNLSKGMYLIRVKLDNQQLGIFNVSKL